MRDLGIAVADTATPQEVFKLFKENAALKFDEMVSAIEQGAKIESVGLQTHKLFSSVGSAADFMKAVEKLDVKTIQEAVIGFSDDALMQVDEACQLKTAIMKADLGDIIG